jgi:hypothetical protein
MAREQAPCGTLERDGARACEEGATARGRRVSGLRGIGELQAVEEVMIKRGGRSSDHGFCLGPPYPPYC